MQLFARNKLLWTVLLVGVAAACYAVWYFFLNRGSEFFGRDGISFWSVTSFAGEPVEPDTFLLFDDKQIALDGPCGQQRWLYERDEDEIDISRPSGAALYCYKTVPPIIEQFSVVREGVATMSINGDRLTLFDDQGKAVLETQREHATGLEYRTWRIANFQLDNTLTATSDAFGEEAPVHVTFIHNSVYGYAGCRYLVGMAKVVEREWIMIDAQHYPADDCRERDIQLGDAIIAALSSGNRMMREKDRVILKDDKDRTQIILTPWDTPQEP